MKYRNLLLALGLAISFNADASGYVFGFSPRTGDVWVDTQLGDMNDYANRDRNSFIDDVVASFGAPRYVVNQYVVDRRWAPGDVYYACALAHEARVPCQNVLQDYDKNHGQGWGVIAKRMGIKPGSPAFHALKGNVGKSNGKFKSKGNNKGPSVMHGDSDHGPGNSGKGGKPDDVGNPGKGKGKDKKGKGH